MRRAEENRTVDNPRSLNRRTAGPAAISARLGPKGTLLYKLVTTTDHKMIGMMYVVACFTFFFIGGLMALLIRTQLASPGLQFLSNEQYNQLFTMHGTVMLLFYATPIVFGFANLVLPLQIGAPDVAFPRLNALSFWLFLLGALSTATVTTHALPIGGLEARRPFPARLSPKGALVYKLVTTTDHKVIGMMYVVACFAFFFIGGLMALFMRTELAMPGLQFLSNEQFNQLFTMHGTVMLLLSGTFTYTFAPQPASVRAWRRISSGSSANTSKEIGRSVISASSRWQNSL